MQRRWPEMYASAISTFSILGRIGGDATKRRTQRAHGGQPLSVSSVGSEAMQLDEGRRYLDARRLSVSSVGSEAMQLVAGPRGPLAHPGAFSILGRIGGDATCPGASGGRGICGSFSILGRIGGDATPWASVPPAPRQRPFSILGRIGGDATHPLTEEHIQQIDFQYPRSDRRRCNQVGKIKSPGNEPLSVSSVGSEAMQPAGCALGFYNQPGFQYPRSDRRRCN